MFVHSTSNNHRRKNTLKVVKLVRFCHNHQKKFGDQLKSKNKTARINELLCKIIACNITVLIAEMYELGIKPEFCNLSAEN
ncbi:TPA: hypothetical protein HA318_01900 [Candidatus Micrarchaeota archaeon]|nr:hypothetical protein [Candidatus Micrarchaeota archaeon]